MKQRIIQLNDSQRLQALRVFAHGVRESTFHIRKILSSGDFYVRSGIKITLKKAVRRRRHCIKLAKQAFRGFIV